MHYDLKDLKLLLDIAQSGSFRQAAERSHLTVSAVSVRMRNLESSFETQLLLRTTRKARLTEAGTRLAEQARILLSQAKNLEVNMERFSGKRKDTVRFYTNYVAMSGRLKTDVSFFLRDHPEVKIDFTLVRRKPIIEALLQGEADLGVLGYLGEVPGLVFSPYVICSYGLIVPADSKTARRFRGSVTLAELEDFPLVALSKETTIQEFFEEKAGEAGVRLDIRARFPSLYSAITPMRILGGGILAPKSSEIAKLDDVRMIDIREPWNRQDLRLCVSDNPERVSPNTAKLLAYLSAAANHRPAQMQESRARFVRKREYVVGKRS